MPNNDPQPGDVYKAGPKTSVNGDKHGDNKRPVGVVERLKRVAICLGRSKHPEADARTLASPANLSIGLDSDAWWQDRHQRPVAKKFWNTGDFTYAGGLPNDEKEDLIAFWKTTDMLGRRNL